MLGRYSESTLRSWRLPCLCGDFRSAERKSPHNKKEEVPCCRRQKGAVSKGVQRSALQRQAVRSGAQQRSLGVEDDMHRHLCQQLAEAALVAERFEKGRVVEWCADARRDAAAEVDPAG